MVPVAISDFCIHLHTHIYTPTCVPTYMLVCMHVHMHTTHMHTEVGEEGEREREKNTERNKSTYETRKKENFIFWFMLFGCHVSTISANSNITKTFFFCLLVETILF